MKGLNKGFTLIELMITVVIIGVLSSIAYPAYVEYVLRAKRADAKAGLLILQLAQEKFRANSPVYAATIDSARSSTTSPGGHYTLAVDSADATNYSLTATPKSPHSDSKCGTFKIDQSGKKQSDGVDDYCWGK